MIKFGIIGFGYMGHKHELKIEQTEGMELEFVILMNPEWMMHQHPE